MAKRRRSIELDDELIQRTRDAAGAPENSGTDVVEDALAVDLGMRALADAQGVGGLAEDDADRIAVDEVRAVRRARDAAP